MCRKTIPFDEAVALLPSGETIHTFRNPNAAMLIGCDWDRAEIISALAKAEEIHVTGEQAQAMGHGLWIASGGGLFIEASACPEGNPA